MKRIVVLLFALFIISSVTTIRPGNAMTTTALPQTGLTGCYNVSGSVITCTGTGQDGEFKTGFPWPNPRFTDNGDQSISDNLTGLMWTKDVNLMETRDPSLYGHTTYDAAGIPTTVPGNTWQQALDYVKKLNTENYLGHNDWRLPNINELATIVNKSQKDQGLWLTSQGFSNVHVGYYWSSTTFAANTTLARGVRMNTGEIGFYGPKDSVGYVWPVRGDQPTLSLSRTGQQNCFSATGSTIDCSGSGQDGEFQVGTAWPSVRFTDNSINNSTDNTITDNMTGLTWTKNANLPSATKSAQEALDYIKALNSIMYLGHNDWRLPNINELESLLNRGVAVQANWLKAQGFINVGLNSGQFNAYVSGTGSPRAPWYARMDDGGVSNYSSYNFLVWPVRGGQSTAVISRSGTGSVTVDVGDIKWDGFTGSTTYDMGTVVTFNATPDSDSTFVGWSGDCNGTGSCTVIMNTSKSIMANFSPSNSVCGSSNGGTYSLAPTKDLCSIGSATAISGNGPWTWTCISSNGGTNASCSANFIDTTAPAITTFYLTSYATTLTVPITLTVTDNVGVAAYCLSQTNSSTTCNWSGTKPTSYTFMNGGINTLYGFVKDAAGNESPSVSATVSIDTKRPSVTNFVLPAASDILNVAITSLIAADDIGVTGYMITETPTPPLSNASGWTATIPTGYTFIVSGNKTLYAWAKDAVGNISDPISANISITLPYVSLISISLSPANSSLAYGRNQQFTATAYYNDGTSAVLSDGLTWSSVSACSLSSLNSYTPIANNSFLLGPLSPLSSSAKLTEAFTQFTEISNRAKLGDANGIAELQSISTILLSLSRDYYASSSGYWSYYYVVKSRLAEVTSLGQRDFASATTNACGLASLRAFAASLDRDVNTFSPESALTNAKGQFTDISVRAKLGEAEAIWQINNVATDFLTASQRYYGGGAGYITDFNAVQQTLSQIQSMVIPISSATISDDGLATGVALGTSVITVTSGAMSKSTTLTILGPDTFIDATCGSSHNQTVTTAPITNLCALGIASSVTGSGPWSWTCNGVNGGTNASCSASLLRNSSLTITVAGTGGGTVTSTPTGIACTRGVCSYSFPSASVVSLLQTPNAISVFSGWAGACNNTSGDCTTTLASDKSVTATFTAAPKAKIGVTGYPSLYAAFTGATSGAMILALDDELVETLTVNKILTLMGGYNSTYTGRTGQPTVITGPLTIRSGKLTVDGVSLK